MKFYIQLLYVCLFLFCAKGVLAQKRNLVNVIEQADALSLSKGIQFFIDSSHELSAKDVALKIKNEAVFKSVEQNSILFDEGDAAVWGTFTLKSELNKPTSYLFRIENYYLNNIGFYEFVGDDLILKGRSGDHLLLSERTIKHRDHLFEIVLLPNESRRFLFDFYRKGKTIVSFEVIKSSSYIETDSNHSMILGIYVGTVLLIALYAFGLFVVMKRVIYLYYTLYVIALGLSLSSVYGLGFRYIYFNAKEFTDYTTTGTIFLAVVFFVLFAIQFLSIKKNNPKWYKFIKVYLIGYFCIALMVIVLYNLEVVFPLLEIHYTLLVVTILLLFVSAIISFEGDKRSSIFFIISFFPILFGSLVQIFLESGSIRNELLLDYILLISSFFETLIISVGIALQVKEQNSIRLSLAQKVMKHEVELNQKIIEGEIKEKTRVALILHDTIGVKLRHLKNLIDKSDKKNVKRELDLLGQDIRDLSHAMAPTVLDYITLPEAIVDIGEKLSTESCQLQIQNHGFSNSLQKETRIVLYNVIQELINNSLKHSKATLITIQFLKSENELSITIEDNGVGFNVSLKKGFGLESIYSRMKGIQGSFNIESETNKGTLSILNLPVKSV